MRYGRGLLQLVLPWTTFEGEKKYTVIKLKIDSHIDHRAVRKGIRKVYKKQIGRSVRKGIIDKLPKLFVSELDLAKLYSQLTVDNFADYLESTEHLYADNDRATSCDEESVSTETGRDMPAMQDSSTLQ